MRHFAFFDDLELERLFLLEPEQFDAATDRDLLAVALGATLYSPATRPRLAEDIAKRAQDGVISTVVCLEDSVPDADLPAAEVNAVEQLRRYATSGHDGPLIFVRVRSVEQIATLVDGLGEHISVLAGFVLPKFTATNGEQYLSAIAQASKQTGHLLRVMPVLESPEITFVESRREALLSIRSLLDAHQDQVLAVRIGATDLSATFGLRRTRDVTVYDVRVIADVIADVVNVFGRDGAGYVITGPVWEYFSGTERMFKPQLRASPFIQHDERRLRARIIAGDLDGLIREVTLDRVNGLTGKTVIHPSHVAAVHALAVVSHEAYLDATDVLDTRAGGGVASSAYGNKMNESKPHAAWARRTMLRARAFGVAREDISFVDLLGASLRL